MDEDLKPGPDAAPCEAITGAVDQPTSVSAAGPLCLVVTSAPNADAIGRTFELAEGRECVIGRSREAGLQVDDPGISRRHARVRCPGADVYVLTDLRSSNGTYVNGRRVHRAALRHGDRIQLGTATVIRFSTRRRLDEAEQRQRQALSAAGVGTWEWDVATRHLAFTGGSERLVRTAAGTDTWLAVHPEDRQRLRDELSRALATGATADLEARLVGPAGGASWVSLRGELLRDESGAPLRIAGALVDVSARKQAEQVMRRQALMFECMSDAALVVDLSGSILDWNPAAARLFGHSRSEALERGPGELLEPGEPEPFLAAAAREIASGGRWKGERRLRRKNGDTCQAELEVVPLRDAAGRHLADLVVCRDVGEQRRLQAQLLLADRLAAMGTLAAGVAHEINNPLAFVQANLACLEELLGARGSAPGEPTARAVDMLADVREGVERIALIVRELKSYSRSGTEAGEAGARIGRAVEYALRIVKSETGKRARVVTEIGDLPSARMPEPQLGQVLVNLILNAAQAFEGAAASNEIRISGEWHAPAGAVLLRVSDSGPGIPESILPRIFDPFFTTKPTGVGTGLGLFVCRSLVEAAGGSIAVESQLGRGTTFTLTLPAVARDQAAAAAPAEQGRAAPPGRDRTPAQARRAPAPPG